MGKKSRRPNRIKTTAPGETTGGSAAACTTARSQEAPVSQTWRIRLIASQAFLNTAQTADGSFNQILERFASKDAGSHLQLKVTPRQLDPILAWFREGSDADNKAELIFPPHLTKQQRAKIHTMTKTVGLGALEALSRGVGSERYISVMRQGSVPQRDEQELSEKQQHKAHFLWKWALNDGLQFSRDEVQEMVFMDLLPDELVQLWSDKAPQQKAVQALCAAIASGDLASVKECITSPEGAKVLRSGVVDLMTGDAPLHLATAAGNAQIIGALVEAGAALNSRDGRNDTALDLARRHDRSDAEGVLLRGGARDPTADNIPGVDALFALERSQDSPGFSTQRGKVEGGDIADGNGGGADLIPGNTGGAGNGIMVSKPVTDSSSSCSASSHSNAAQSSGSGGKYYCNSARDQPRANSSTCTGGTNSRTAVTEPVPTDGEPTTLPDSQTSPPDEVTLSKANNGESASLLHNITPTNDGPSDGKTFLPDKSSDLPDNVGAESPEAFETTSTDFEVSSGSMKQSDRKTVLPAASDNLSNMSAKQQPLRVRAAACETSTVAPEHVSEHVSDPADEASTLAEAAAPATQESGVLSLSNGSSSALLESGGRTPGSVSGKNESTTIFNGSSAAANGKIPICTARSHSRSDISDSSSDDSESCATVSVSSARREDSAAVEFDATRPDTARSSSDSQTSPAPAAATSTISLSQEVEPAAPGQPSMTHQATLDAAGSTESLSRPRDSARQSQDVAPLSAAAALVQAAHSGAPSNRPGAVLDRCEGHKVGKTPSDKALASEQQPQYLQGCFSPPSSAAGGRGATIAADSDDDDCADSSAATATPHGSETASVIRPHAADRDIGRIPTNSRQKQRQQEDSIQEEIDESSTLMPAGNSATGQPALEEASSNASRGSFEFGTRCSGEGAVLTGQLATFPSFASSMTSLQAPSKCSSQEEAARPTSGEHGSGASTPTGSVASSISLNDMFAAHTSAEGVRPQRKGSLVGDELQHMPCLPTKAHRLTLVGGCNPGGTVCSATHSPGDTSSRANIPQQSFDSVGVGIVHHGICELPSKDEANIGKVNYQSKRQVANGNCETQDKLLGTARIISSDDDVKCQGNLSVPKASSSTWRNWAPSNLLAVCGYGGIAVACVAALVVITRPYRR